MTSEPQFQGLSTIEAKALLEKYGPNSIPESLPSPIRLFLEKLWSPIPWMLEVSLFLELLLHHHVEAFIITLLLFINAILSFFQENAAQKALALLRRKLSVQSRVFRDDSWQTIEANEDELLRLAALSSSEATQDPFDLAIINMAKKNSIVGRGPRLSPRASIVAPPKEEFHPISEVA